MPMVRVSNGGTDDNIYSFLWNGNLSGMQLKSGIPVATPSASITINGLTFTGSGYGASTNFKASVAGNWYYPSTNGTAVTHAGANQAVTTGTVSYLAFIAD